MANHDFNKPCDCKECSTSRRHDICPACGNVHVFSIVCSSAWETDRKGFTYVDFTEPSGPKIDFQCPCGHEFQVKHYSNYEPHKTLAVNEERERKAAAARCDSCGKIEGFDLGLKAWDRISLESFDNQQLCQVCIAKRVLETTPDPTDEDNKYTFDHSKRQYILEKVRITCPDCGKRRWLNASNAWRKRCKSCYYGEEKTKKLPLNFFKR
ncbi:hypothetical protein CXK86_20080 [Paenibacillus sp. BGI2013]|nr:hypothetical protein CXK86_20080 [Paenibacillus sp. BGI2013]